MLSIENIVQNEIGKMTAKMCQRPGCLVNMPWEINLPDAHTQGWLHSGECFPKIINADHTFL